MTLRDVIFKSFTKGLRNYLSYFFAGVFCTAMFFTYSTIILIDQVEDSSEYPIKLLLITTCIIICLFSIFFINYSHQNFIGKKKKEMATYLVLGMKHKDGMKLLFTETMMIALVSIITGMLTGTIVSRLFQLIVIRLAGLDNIDYKLSVLNFVVTAIVFFVIYLICFILSANQMKKQDVILLIRDQKARKSKPYKKIHTIAAIAGLVLMIFSAIFILNVSSNHHINSKLWVLFTFLGSGYIGLTLVIICGGKALVHYMQKRKHYYENMLTVNGIDFQYHQNIKIIMILALLASMIVLLVGSPIALVNISADIAEESNSDIEYATIAKYDEAAVNKIVNQKKISEEDVYDISYVFDTKQALKPIVSVSQYEEQYHKRLKVQKGQIYHLITTWIPGDNGVSVGNEYTIAYGNETQTFTVCDSVKGDWKCPNLIMTGSVLVLSDEDYESLSQEFPTMTIHLITYEKGWRDTKKIAEGLQQELGDNGFINSRIGIYESLKHGYSIFLFVACSMCFMFFVSTGFVLYFKQYNDIDEEKKLYQRLFYMGISDQVVKKSIAQKMAVVYFVPLLGTIMGILLMYYMASIFGGNAIITLFMKWGMLGVLCYALAQTTFYIMLKHAYVKDVITVS